MASGVLRAARAGGEVFYTDMQPAQRVVEQFDPRDDGQIIALELMAILLGARFPSFVVFSCAVWGAHA